MNQTCILRKRKENLVTPMAKAAARVNPQYVYCENPIFCKNLSESLQRVVEDFVKGKSNGTAAKKADLKTYIVPNFKKYPEATALAAQAITDVGDSA